MCTAQHVCIKASSQIVPPFPEIVMLACCASLYSIIILQDGDNLIWIQLRMLCGEDKCLYGWMSRGRGSNLPVFISRTISPPIKIMKVWRLLSYAAAAHNEVLLLQWNIPWVLWCSQTNVMSRQWPGISFCRNFKYNYLLCTHTL